MYVQKVQSYFEDKADQYDDVEKQSYWRLSDRLLWEVMASKVIPLLPEKFSFCDAGGGTGRWSFKILKNYDHAVGTTVDFSRFMLEQARKKQKENALQARWTLIEQDLHNLKDIADNSFDLVFNFHNVIGFVEDPGKVTAELVRVLKPNGILCTLAPNAYHAGYFNLKNGKIDEAKKAISQKGRFTEQMPDIHLFTPSRCEHMMTAHGMETIFMNGFPVLIYPGYAETQLQGQTQSLTALLESEEGMESIYALEKSLLENEDAAARGNNIFIAARKKS
jgi:ubiquinone/menaquinone biosynthesis C-methylase UbiE